MKKYDLLKVLGITFAIVFLLSWIIPAGAYSEGKFVATGTTTPIGLYDIFRIPAITIATFIQYGLVFLAIGGFYGVLNKTGVYSKLVDGLAKKWNKNKNKFMILTIIIFALLTSITGLANVVFILVPLFVAILLKLGFNKITAFSSTVGAILIGQIGCTFGFNVWGYLKYTFDLDMTTLLLARIVLLVMTLVLFIMLVKKNDKETKNKKEENIPLYEQTESKKKTMPIIVISIISIILLMVGLYNWYYGLEIDFFATLNETIMTYEFNGYPLFGNLFGTVSEFGYWGNYDIVTILVIASLIIGWIYNLKLDDILKEFKDGSKEMLKPALYSMLASVIFAIFINMENGNFVATIMSKFIENSENFTFTGTIGSALISSFAYNDFYTLLTTFSSAFTGFEKTIIPVVAFILQTMYGIVMLIAPTSIYLLAGLSYLQIPYKEWVKYIWKFLLTIFGVVVVVAFVLTTLV